jgi:hypothetical protein
VPISRIKLIDQLGYLGDSKIAQKIIKGTFDIPDEIDNATTLILEEIGKIGVQLSNGKVKIEITKEELQNFWRRIKDDPDGRIEAAGAKALGTGDYAPLGSDIIHSVSNPIPKLTGSIHVYGGDFFEEERSEWEPETLAEQPIDLDKIKAIFND